MSEAMRRLTPSRAPVGPPLSSRTAVTSAPPSPSSLAVQVEEMAQRLVRQEEEMARLREAVGGKSRAHPRKNLIDRLVGPLRQTFDARPVTPL